MYNISVSRFIFTVIVGAAAAGCALDKGPAGIDADQAKELVMTRYDQFAQSGGSACED
jgi:hypothetical protein